MAVCKNNLKQIGLAMHNDHDTYKTFPVGHYYRGHFDGNPNNQLKMTTANLFLAIPRLCRLSTTWILI